MISMLTCAWFTKSLGTTISNLNCTLRGALYALASCPLLKKIATKKCKKIAISLGNTHTTIQFYEKHRLCFGCVQFMWKFNFEFYNRHKYRCVCGMELLYQLWILLHQRMCNVRCVHCQGLVEHCRLWHVLRARRYLLKPISAYL